MREAEAGSLGQGRPTPEVSQVDAAAPYVAAHAATASLAYRTVFLMCPAALTSSDARAPGDLSDVVSSQI